MSNGEHQILGIEEKAIEDTIGKFANTILFVNLVISIFGSILNFFHLIVLTRKTMRISSTNTLLTGIAICDFLVCSITIYKWFTFPDIEHPECSTSASYIKIQTDMILWTFHDYLRRCTCVLAVLMATLRVFIVKQAAFARIGRLSKPMFGWCVVIGLWVFGSVPSIFYHFHFHVVEYRTTPLPEICADYQNINQPPRYSVDMTSFYYDNNMIITRVYSMVVAMTFKILPCLMFPLLTFLLVRELRRAKVGRRTANDEKNELTTKLVILLTITFFVAEAPIGMVIGARAFLPLVATKFTIMITDISYFFTIMQTLNSLSHCFINFAMSSQYRETLRRIFGLKVAKRTEIGWNKQSVSAVH